jgi:hypothetical protein
VATGAEDKSVGGQNLATNLSDAPTLNDAPEGDENAGADKTRDQITHPYCLARAMMSAVKAASSSAVLGFLRCVERC